MKLNDTRQKTAAHSRSHSIIRTAPLPKAVYGDRTAPKTRKSGAAGNNKQLSIHRLGSDKPSPPLPHESATCSASMLPETERHRERTLRNRFRKDLTIGDFTEPTCATRRKRPAASIIRIRPVSIPLPPPTHKTTAPNTKRPPKHKNIERISYLRLSKPIR